MSSDFDWLWLALLAVVLPLFLTIMPIWFLAGRGKDFGLKALKRCYRGVETSQEPCEGDVHVVYHTYNGLLFFADIQEHRFSARPDQAKELLGRLYRYNLGWGMLTPAFLIVPFLATFDYIGQSRSIDRQSLNR